MRPDCAACCFFRLVETKGRRKRSLCMLTGEKKPYAGMYGCRFLAGAWSQIDAILGLQNPDDCGNTGDPNHTKQAPAFSRKGMNVAKTYALDDSIGLPINHTSREAGRQFVRPEYREVPVASVARERTGCLFHV